MRERDKTDEYEQMGVISQPTDLKGLLRREPDNQEAREPPDLSTF
jgi:hypothetical protein